MQLQARLVHVDGERCVVLITAREGDRLLGSALGEAAGAEEAEDRALARLLGRLGAAPQPASPPVGTIRRPPPSPAADPCANGESKAAHALPTPAPAAPPAHLAAPPTAPPSMPIHGEPAAAEPPLDPEDWSAELAQLDLQLRRLGWGREQEATFLQRAFGHPSRNRLTTYADLIAYLGALESFGPAVDPATATVPLRRPDLIVQCDQLLERLGWNAEQGRQFLERHLDASSRQQLSDAQLLHFNMLLEGEILASPEGMGAG